MGACCEKGSPSAAAPHDEDEGLYHALARTYEEDEALQHAMVARTHIAQDPERKKEAKTEEAAIYRDKKAVSALKAILGHNESILEQAGSYRQKCIKQHAKWRSEDPARQAEFAIDSFDFLSIADVGLLRAWVLPVNEFLEAGEFEKFEDCFSKLVWVDLATAANKENVNEPKVVFISHRWLSPEHPDPTGLQYRIAVEKLEEIMEMREIAAVWVDFSCIPQTRSPLAIKVRSQLLQCLSPIQHHMRTLIIRTLTDSYERRLWCVTEYLICQLSGKSHIEDTDFSQHENYGARRLYENVIKGLSQERVQEEFDRYEVTNGGDKAYIFKNWITYLRTLTAGVRDLTKQITGSEPVPFLMLDYLRFWCYFSRSDILANETSLGLIGYILIFCKANCCRVRQVNADLVQEISRLSDARTQQQIGALMEELERTEPQHRSIIKPFFFQSPYRDLNVVPQGFLTDYRAATPCNNVRINLFYVLFSSYLKHRSAIDRVFEHQIESDYE